MLFARTPTRNRRRRPGRWACCPAWHCGRSRRRTSAHGSRPWSGCSSCGRSRRRKVRSGEGSAVSGDPTKLYEQFAPPERLALLIEAMARNDAAEAQRLHRTCPRFTYTGPDVQFTERYTLAFDIMAVISIDLRCAWAKLHVMR